MSDRQTVAPSPFHIECRKVWVIVHSIVRQSSTAIYIGDHHQPLGEIPIRKPEKNVHYTRSCSKLPPRFYAYRIHAYHPLTGRFQSTITPDPYSTACASHQGLTVDWFSCTADCTGKPLGQSWLKKTSRTKLLSGITTNVWNWYTMCIIAYVGVFMCVCYYKGFLHQLKRTCVHIARNCKSKRTNRFQWFLRDSDWPAS